MVTIVPLFRVQIVFFNFFSHIQMKKGSNPWQPPQESFHSKTWICNFHGEKWTYVSLGTWETWLSLCFFEKCEPICLRELCFLKEIRPFGVGNHVFGPFALGELPRVVHPFVKNNENLRKIMSPRPLG